MSKYTKYNILYVYQCMYKLSRVSCFYVQTNIYQRNEDEQLLRVNINTNKRHTI